eukprot:5438103-Pyramimonas_sp.AAC.1
MARHGTAGTHHPTTAGTGVSGGTGREKRLLAGKLDIRDLPWDDREKVRRATGWTLRAISRMLRAT